MLAAVALAAALAWRCRPRSALCALGAAAHLVLLRRHLLALRPPQGAASEGPLGQHRAEAAAPADVAGSWQHARRGGAYEDFMEQYPVLEFSWHRPNSCAGTPARPPRLTSWTLRTVRATSLPNLLDRFDWLVNVSPLWDLGDADRPLSRRRVPDPHTILAGPNTVQSLLLEAKARALDKARAAQRVLVFAGSVLYMSDAFGCAGEEACAPVLAALHTYFGSIFHLNKDLPLDGVRTLPVGLVEHYLRPPGVAEAAAEAIASASSGAKPRRVLAAWGANPHLPETSWGRPGTSSAALILEQSSNVKGRAKGQPAMRISRSSARAWAQCPAAAALGVELRSISREAWWKELATYRFAMAPMGDGIHSPKMVEALLVLTVPIVQRGPYPVYGDLEHLGFPLAVVEEWQEVSEAKLSWWEAHLAAPQRLESFRANCLTAEGYWRIITEQRTATRCV